MIMMMLRISGKNTAVDKYKIEFYYSDVKENLQYILIKYYILIDN